MGIVRGAVAFVGAVIWLSLQPVKKIMQMKPGGQAVIREYYKTNGLTDSSR